MTSINVELTLRERPLCFCQMEPPISAAQGDVVTGQVSQFLIGIGNMLNTHPDLRSQVDERTGQLLISIGRKLRHNSR